MQQRQAESRGGGGEGGLQESLLPAAPPAAPPSGPLSFSIQDQSNADDIDGQSRQPTPLSPSAPKALASWGLTYSPVVCSQSIWLILLSLNAIGPFSSDAYLPNLPDIEKDLSTTAGLASLTIQINWIVLGLINPVIGGLSDSYGRRAITVVSLCVFVVGAVGSAMSKTLNQLMVARVVMGVGQAVSVIASAVIRDLVDDTAERMRITGIFNMLQPLMILAAPSIGGVVGALVGWRDLFWGLAGWGLLTMLLVGLCVPESNKAYLARKAAKANQALAAGGFGLADNGGGRLARTSTSPAGASPPPPPEVGMPPLDEVPPRTLCQKLCEMFSSVTFTGLTLTAAMFMGGVRSMLSTIPFVYKDFYCIGTEYMGFLIAVPTGCGIVSSLVGAPSSLSSPAPTSYL